MRVKHRNEGYCFEHNSGEVWSCKYENKFVEVVVETKFMPKSIVVKKCGCFWAASNLEYLEYLYEKQHENNS